MKPGRPRNLVLMIIGLATAHRTAAVRAKGPLYTSPVRRAGFGMDTNQSAVGAIYRLLCIERAFSPQDRIGPVPSPVGWAGIRRAFGPERRNAGANRIIIFPFFSRKFLGPLQDSEAETLRMYSWVQHRRGPSTA